MSKKITDLLSDGTLDKKQSQEVRQLDQSFREIEAYYGAAFTKVQEYQSRLDGDIKHWTNQDRLIKNKESKTIVAAQ